MKLRHLLLGAVLAGAATANAGTFEWTPAMNYPWATGEIKQAWALEEVAFGSDVANLKTTDVMPYFESDESGNKITATSGSAAWGAYAYAFSPSDFKDNGEYTLVMPEGMLVNEAGDLSAEVKKYYTFDIEGLGGAGMFDDFEVISLTPDLSVAQSLWDDQEFVINTNHNDAIGYTVLTVTDLTPDDPDEAHVLYATNWNELNPRGIGNSNPIKFTAMNPGGKPYKFYKGHTYKATFTFFNGENDHNKDTGVPTPVVATANYEFEGLVKSFEYSSVKLVNVSPTPLENAESGAAAFVIEQPSEAKFFYTFSAPVDVYKAEIPLGPMGGEDVSTCLTCNDDKTEWTLDLTDVETVLKSDASIIVNIFANDMEGYHLRGNTGYEDNSCYQYTWMCQLGSPTFTVKIPADGSTVKSLSKVVVVSDNGQTINWSYSGSAQIFTLGRDLVGTLVFDENTSVVSDTELQFTTWKPAGQTEECPLYFKEPGSYSLVFEKAAFIFGEESDSKMSGNQAIGFKISDESSSDPGQTVDEVTYWEPVAVTPANHSDVEQLSKIEIEFPSLVVPLLYDAYVYDGEGNKLDVTVDVGFDWNNDNLGVINISPAITAPGNYSIFIPKGTFCDEPYGESMGKKGQTNDDMTLYYTIVGGTEPEPEVITVVSVDPAEGQVIELKDFTITFNIPVKCIENEALILDPKGNIVEKGTITVSEADAKTINVSFAEPVTADGEYTLYIVEESLEGENDVKNRSIRLNYTVGTPKEPVLEVVSVNPAEGEVESLRVIDIHFEGFWVDLAAEEATAEVKNADGETVATPMIDYHPEDYNAIEIAFEAPITEAGEYTVTIPAGLVIGGGVANTEIVLHYTVKGVGDGVDFVTIDADSVIYDLNGHRVYGEKLPKGIYIVNGKKVVLK